MLTMLAARLSIFEDIMNLAVVQNLDSNDIDNHGLNAVTGGLVQEALTHATRETFDGVQSSYEISC